VNRYGFLVMGIAWRILHDREEAKDIYQETFLRFHTAWLRGEEITYPKAWLYRTALNTACNRQRQRSREISYEEQEDCLERVGSDGRTEVEQTLLVNQIRQMAARLPDRQREVFILRNFEGLSFTEISEILDCTPETARANEYQALQKIRSWMTHDYESERKVGSR
jgi:RNA polymerase sigma-70 factor (ECF subfamily)